MEAETRPKDGADSPGGSAEDGREDRELIAEILTSGAPSSGIFPRRARSGAVEDCYRILVTRYWKAVLVLLKSRVSSERDAEDLAQEAFLRAFRSLPKLEDPKLFLGWLLRITRNLATDHLRRRRSDVSLDAIETGIARPGSGDGSSEDRFEDIVEREDEVAKVMASVDLLPDLYREVVTLRYVQDLSNRELAERLGEPEGTIRNRLFRALGKLRDFLGSPAVQTHDPESDESGRNAPEAS